MEAKDIIEIIINLIILLFGSTTNGLVIFMFARCRTLQTLPNLLILNLSVCNLIQILLIPLVCADLITGGQFYGNVVCEITGSMLCVSCVGSILFITTVSVIRYVIIVHASLGAHFLSWNKVIIASGLIWIITVILVIPAWTGPGDIHYHIVSRICLFDWFANIPYTVMLGIIAFGVPLCLIAYSYIRIYLLYRASRSRVSAHNSTESATKLRDLKLALHLFLTFCAFAVCWSPYLVLVFFVDPNGTMNPWMHHGSRTLIVAMAAIGPLLYWFLNSSTREELKTMCIGHDTRHERTTSGDTSGQLTATSCIH